MNGFQYNYYYMNTMIVISTVYAYLRVFVMPDLLGATMPLMLQSLTAYTIWSECVRLAKVCEWLTFST